MAFVSLKQFLSQIGLATAEQFDEWNKAWKVAVGSGSQESLLAFICREKGIAEDVFLQKLAQALNWPYLDLTKLKVAAGGPQPDLNQSRLPIFRRAHGRQTTAPCRWRSAIPLIRRC